MNTYEVIQLAKKHVDNRAEMASSARFCLDEAVARQAEGRSVEARNWAVKSLECSVGIFHPDYRAADPRC